MPPQSIENKLTDINKRMDDLFTEMNKCNEGVIFMNSKFEDFRKDMEKIKRDSKKMKEENIELKREIGVLKKSNEEILQALNVLEREKISNELLCSNLIETNGEDLPELVIRLGKVAGFTLEKSMIRSIYRTKSRKKDIPGNVNISFDSQGTRDRYLEAVKKKRPGNKDVGITTVSDNLYFKERLTKVDNEIYYQALKFKRDNGYKFLWTRGGKIFLREKEGARFIILNQFQDLERLIG